MSNECDGSEIASVDNLDVDELIRFGLSMPASLVQQLDIWRKDQGYVNRSEAIRDMVRDKLAASNWQRAALDSASQVVGVVVLVYDHTTRQLSEDLTRMQHHDHGTAVATLHIHLSEDYCLEVIVLRGSQTEVLDMAEHLISARGVLHGKFVPATTGADLA